MTTLARRLSGATLFAVLAATGCSSGPSFGVVTGQVTVKGKPADKVRVEFHPDSLAGTTGPSSFAETDADGRYSLIYSSAAGSGPGAVVGKHKVVLQDLRLAESETGKGIPIRLPVECGAVLTTPLSREVKPGEQTIDIPIN
jgi:hypothetical protein